MHACENTTQFYQPTTANEAVLLHQNNVLFQENYKRSQNEQVLYNEWQKVIAGKKQLSDMIEEMQLQIAELENKFKTSEVMGNANTSSNQEETRVDYFTDEEQLAEETEWIRVKNKSKKRKMNTSPTPLQQQRGASEPPQQKDKRMPAPPPIMVDGIKVYDEFYDKITEHIPASKFNTKLMKGGSIKVNVADGEVYRMLTNILLEGRYAWHSYEDKHTRPIRVMARNLHHSCNPGRIVSDLRARGYKAIDAANKLQWRSKEPLDMFILTFSADENTNKIYEITSILGSKVEIQPLRKSKLIPQCKQCQAYGHTQRYCNKDPRCVKCAGKHHTKECRKPKEAQPKCVHCGEAHPANYRGCSVAIELQKIKTQNMKAKRTTFPQRQSATNPRQANNTTEVRNQSSIPQKEKREMTYAQAVTNLNKQNNVQENEDVKQTLQLILDKLTKQEALFTTFDERIKKLEYSAQGAIPKTKQK